MDMFFVLIGLGIVGTMFIGGIMGFVANSRITRLEAEIKKLRTHLRKQLSPDIEFTPSMRPERTRKPEPANHEDIRPKPQPVMASTSSRPKMVQREDQSETAQPASKPAQTAAPHKPQIQKSAPQKPKRKKRSFEEEIGARWAVWVGGIALAFGAIFLLKYTIEAGVFSPAMRIALAALMGFVLLGAGEFLRRVDGGNAKLPPALSQLRRTAYIPGVLTGVGIFALLGTTYAAYALYGFLGPALTFTLLGLISMASLALSLLHGPKMAALGLVASLVTPMLIDMGPPNYFLLYTYLIIVSLAALILAWKRDWPWLNVLTLFGALGWSFMSIDATDKNTTYGAWLIFTGLLFALSTLIANTYNKEHPVKTADAKQDKDRKKPVQGLVHNNVSACIWALIAAMLFLFLASNSQHFTFPHDYMAIGFGFVLMVVGWRIPKQSANIIIGGILAALTLWLFADKTSSFSLILGLTLLTIIAVTGLSFLKTRQAKAANYQHLWSGFGAALPVALSLGLYGSLHDFDAPLTAMVLGALTCINAALAFVLWRKNPNTHNDKNDAVTIYTIAAAATYTLAVLIGFSGLVETVLLMLGIIICAGLYTRTSIPALRWSAAGFALLSAAHTLLIRIADGDVSERIILNELWIYFALPAVLCAAAAWLLSRKSKDAKHNDIWSEGLKALTLTFTALFFVFQIRHFMNGGNVLSDTFGFDEMALQVMVGLSFTLGGTLLGRPDKTDILAPNQKRPPHELLIPGLATAVSVATLFMFVMGICIRYNPLFTDDTFIKGGALINSLALAYLLPALALAAITYLSRAHRPKPYVQITGALSLVAIMLYLTTMVRFMFAGNNIHLLDNPLKDAELYTISAVWLVFGIALLIAGLKLKQKDIRLASALVITLTVLKAFLVDMASLEGVLRAMSFVVLGIVLIVIGRVYQKLLFSQTTKEAATQDELEQSREEL